MRDGNTWSAPGFVLGTAAWSWIALTYYQAKCFAPVRMPGAGGVLDYYTSFRLLLTMIAAVTGAGTLLSLRSRRRTLMMAANVMLPLEMYLLATVYDFCPVLVWIMGIAAVAALLFYGWVIFVESRGRVIRKCWWYLHGTRILLAVVLLPALLYIWGMDKGVVTVASAAPASMEGIEEHSIANHIEELVMLEESRWQKASMQEKGELLQTIAAIETRYLGLKQVPAVKVVCLPSSLLGKFVPSEYTVYVSADVVKYDTGEKALEVLLHEMYHVYQRHLADVYQNVPAEYRSLMLFDSARTYLEEFADYTDGSEDYEAYASQRLEMTARAYAANSIADYAEAIAAYLEEENANE